MGRKLSWWWTLAASYEGRVVRRRTFSCCYQLRVQSLGIIMTLDDSGTEWLIKHTSDSARNVSREAKLRKINCPPLKNLIIFWILDEGHYPYFATKTPIQASVEIGKLPPISPPLLWSKYTILTFFHLGEHLKWYCKFIAHKHSCFKFFSYSTRKKCFCSKIYIFSYWGDTCQVQKNEGIFHG